jgi:hypothetical protein
MKYIHNESILMMKKISLDGFSVTYRLFETIGDHSASYSALVSLRFQNGDEEDYYIPDFAAERICAELLFDKLCNNYVLPCEVEEIYSDGFAEIL